MEITGKQLIGKSQSGIGKVQFSAFNPSTNKPLDAVFFEATKREINRAAALAEKAFHVYRQKSDVQRAVFLETIADEILALGDTLIHTAQSETALPEARLQGEQIGRAHV